STQDEKTTHGIAIKVAEEKLAQTIEANRKEDQNLSAQVRKLIASARDLRREMNLPTPGFPRPPTKPPPPRGSIVEKRTPALPSKLDGGEERSLSPSEQRAYDRDMRDYEQALRDYPAKFAAWQIKDQVRRKDLEDQMAARDKELVDARAE